MEEYYYSKKGQSLGPTSVDHIIELVHSGELDALQDLVWKEGMEAWAPVSARITIPPAPPRIPEEEPPEADTLYAPPHSRLTETAALDDHARNVKRCHFPVLLALSLIALMVSTTGIEKSELLKVFQSVSEANPPRLPDLSQLNPAGTAWLYAGLGLQLISTCLGLVYLYRAWLIIQPGQPLTTPAKAVGFLFIPFFNFYWFFVAYHKWSQEWNRITQGPRPGRPSLPVMVPGIFLASCISSLASMVVPLAGLISFALSMLCHFHICRAVNSLAGRP